MNRILAAFALLALPAAVIAEDDKPIEGIGPTGKITKLHTGFGHSEGPAADGQGNVYFSDVPASKIYKVDAKGKLTTFDENTGHANGLFVRGKNAKDGLVMYACRMDGDIVVYKLNGAVPPEKKVVVATYNGKPFNAPNDLTFDKQGGMYFTDPAFRAPGKTSNIPGPLPQDKLGVYYLTPEGKISRIIDDLINPNGVKLSPDEKTLYVVQTGPAEMMSYPVEGPGKIGKGRVFCTYKMPEDKKASGGGDGMTVDEKGNLYFTSTLGLQVFDPTGKALGIIPIPEQPSNCTFGGPDNKTLYVTAKTSLYAMPMAVKGHVYPGGK